MQSVFEFDDEFDDEFEDLSDEVQHIQNQKVNISDEEYIFENNSVTYYNYAIFWKTVDSLWDYTSYDRDESKSKIRDYLQILASDCLLKLSASIDHVTLLFRPNMFIDFKEVSYVSKEFGDTRISIYNPNMVLKGPLQTTWPITLQMHDNEYIQFPITFHNDLVE